MFIVFVYLQQQIRRLCEEKETKGGHEIEVSAYEFSSVY